ncbi:alpha/beta hydrolase [Steroidobacter sp.]|uniref:alpha/beta hydrolase n=1 Tax=Steroidobacter sp. TaxID=1978227 RepID=UPI001A639783|nr:alpha/beta hydrolase [Steroidobacter sp.]MBL8265024.1 alpha/beta hydrolase [Steroidobacter sp.]
MGIVVMTMITLTAAAQPVDDFRPTPEEQQRFELMSRPEAWFLQALKGPREVSDGQHLDPKLQYYLEERRRRTPEQVQLGLATFLDPHARAGTLDRLNREWALFTKVTAPMSKVEDRKIDGRGGPLPIRIYTPKVSAEAPLPLLVYFHGGGWLYSGIEATDRFARLVANEAQAIVVSVEYRLAPEHLWPASNDDGEDAFLWARANAKSLGSEPDLVAVGGDSAGGHISLDISLRQIAAKRPLPAYQLLYYTSSDFNDKDESYRLFTNGYGLDATFRNFMLANVFPGDLLQRSTKALNDSNFIGMPATIIVSAGFDMLRDSSRRLSQRFTNAGVPAMYLNYPTLAHGFLQWSAVVPDAERASVDTARLFGTAVRSRVAMLRQKNNSRGE